MRLKQFPTGNQISIDKLANNPYPLFQALLADEPITYVPAFNMWMVPRREDVIAILRDADTFTMEPPAGQINPMEALFGPMMLSMDGPEHKRIRDVFQEPFRPKHVRTFYQELISEIVDQLVADMVGEDVVDLTAVFSDKLAILTVVATLGLDVNDIRTFRDWYDAFGSAIGNIQGNPDVAQAGAAAFQTFEALIVAQIEALRKRPNSSVLSEIIHNPHDQLDTAQIVSNCALTFFGGVETTTSMISNALWCLLTYRDAWEKMVERPSLLTNGLEETMRFETAVQSAMRFPTRDVTLHGVEIKTGAKIYCMLGAANRDPRMFAEPDRFDPLRTNANKHLSFAYGPHFCFGAPLARQEALIGIRKLIQQFPKMRLHSAHLTRPVGHEFRSPPHLYVEL
ncbi:MAG: cytochrome P450 [Chloroflexota bacterium]